MSAGERSLADARDQRHGCVLGLGFGADGC